MERLERQHGLVPFQESVSMSEAASMTSESHFCPVEQQHDYLFISRMHVRVRRCWFQRSWLCGPSMPYGSRAKTLGSLNLDTKGSSLTMMAKQGRATGASANLVNPAKLTCKFPKEPL